MRRRRSRAAWIASSISIFATAACLFPDVSPLEAREGGVTDASTTNDSPAPPSVIANTGHVTAPSGNAQQTHVVWANVSKRWWLFYIDDDTTTLKTRSSADFATWTDGASLMLAHTNAGEGRNFSVAYAELGGADVVHVSMSHATNGGAGPLVHSHTRAVIAGSAITFGAPADVCSIDASATGPDGPSTFVDGSGTVWDATGFVASSGTNGNGYNNEDMFVADTKDNGTTWSSSFEQTTIEVVNTTVNARAFFNAGGLGALWEGGDQDPDPTNIHFSVFQSGSWTQADTIFDQDGEQDPNDWDSANLSTTNGAEAHIVRALLAGGYEHAYGSGTNGMNAAAPASQTRNAGTGVVVLADPSHLAAFDLALDGSLTESRWDGSQLQWSAWTTLAGAGSRSFLSGYCPDLDAHPEANGCAVIWTTGTNATAIDGQLVSVK
jgi:hypothetical protein